MMGSTQRVLGSIVSLWRYPVKSMMGEELNAADITKRGLLGDRAYALVDGSDGEGQPRSESETKGNTCQPLIHCDRLLFTHACKDE